MNTISLIAFSLILASLVIGFLFPLVSCNYSSGSAQIAQRWQHGSDPLQMHHFSGISRTSRRSKLSIQRLLPCFPPDNSAEVLQIMQNMRILRIVSF